MLQDISKNTVHGICVIFPVGCADGQWRFLRITLTRNEAQIMWIGMFYQ